MSLALRKEDFDFEPVAQSMDWQRAFKAVETVRDFVKVVDRFERDSLIWRAKMKSKLETGLEKIEKQAKGIDIADVRAELLPILDSAIEAVASAQSTYSEPFHSRPDAQELLTRISGVSGPVGKLIRKQFDRVEDIRIAQYNAIVDMYYTVLAYRAEHDLDAGEGESFDNAEDLETFLKAQV